MKTWYMKPSRCILLCLTLIASLCGAQAQDLGDILFGTEKSGYKGQYDFKGKRKNGYGMERYKNGNIYVGDFNKDDISGRGMLLAFEKGISQVEGAVVYIGNWMNGKKEGRGTCYDRQGNIVFHGNFEKDKPAAPSGTPSTKLFRTVEMDDELYVGETEDEMPHGYGLKLTTEGAILFGTFRDGSPRGVCMTLYAGDVWEVGRYSNGTYSAFNNSTAAKNREEEYRFTSKQQRAQNRASIFEATKEFVQGGLAIASMVTEIRSGGATAAGGGESGVAGESIADGKDYDYYFTKYKIWLSKTKNAYEDRVNYKLKADDARSGRVATASLRLLRTYQRMLKTIRMSAKKNGHSIPAHELESVTF